MKTPTLRLVSSLLGIGLLAGGASLRAQENLIITEFMALNNSTLVDEDGAYSDWIEIYNAGSTPVNLDRWCLTDNADNLTKWRFPNVTLAPYTYRIIFASNKNRTNAAAPLHSNFALSGGGEFLALVRPDGTTIVSAYAPAFPAQQQDISYGFGMLPNPANSLVPSGASAKWLVPSGSIGTAWTGVGYDDTTWSSGPTGVGFDAGTNYDSVIATDIGAQMRSNNASAYLRMPFTVTDPTEFQELKLRLRYDDGFVAYLNGTEMVRTNAPASPVWNSAATGLHGSEPGASGKLEADFDTVTNTYTVSQFLASGYSNPTPPTNSPANAGSTGRFLHLLNDGSLYNFNAVAFNQTAPGKYPLITADFDFRIASPNGDPADGFAFMIIPTAVYGTSGPGVLRSALAVEEPSYAGVFSVGFDLYPHASQNDVSIHWNGQEYENFTIPRTTIELVSGQFHRCHVELELAQNRLGSYVTVVITPNVNAGGGAPFTAINRWLIPGLTNYDSRVEFAARTGGLDMSVDIDNIDVQFGYPRGLTPIEEIDLSQYVTLLQPGANVLAIQGLNIAATDADFLLVPELVARGLLIQTNAPLSFDVPTPGTINGAGAALTAAEPEFSVPGGVYTNNLIVALSSPLPGAVIHYTLNGGVVTEDSPTYSGPIGVSNSAMISARVYAPGHLASSPASHSYTLLDSSVFNFSSPLPLIVIDTFGQILLQNMEPRATANFTVIDARQPNGRATLLSRPDYQGRAGVEGRGQSSWGFAKKPYNVELRDAYDLDRDVSILGFPADSDFALFNPYDEKTLMNDFLAYELFEKMGHYSVRRRHVEVFLNGIRPDNSADSSGKVGTNDYVGVYVLLERIKIAKDRVDIEPPQTGDPGDPITGGYMWKKDKGSPGDVVFTTPTQTSTSTAAESDSLKFHDPKGEDLTPVQQAWLTNYLTEFEYVLFGPNWRDPDNGYAKYIDFPSWVDHYWMVEFAKQIDGYRLSDYLYLPRGGKIHFGPIWDWNLSFGNANYLDGGNTNGWYYPLISAMQHMYYRRVVGDGSASSGDPDFHQKLIDRWGELRTDLFHPSNLFARIDQLTNYFNEAMARDYVRWPRINTYIWPNPDGANTVPTGTDGTTAIWNVNYATPSSYAVLIGEMKKWIGGRYAWIDSLYLKAPVLSRYSGSPSVPLSMYSSTGMVYYTTDGSDPRLPGGLVSPNAHLYSGSATLPTNARIFARAWHTNAWSPPTQAVFGYPTAALAITELMYHPAPDVSGIDTNYEFIELSNMGAEAIDLSGMRFIDGVSFTFPPGGIQTVGTVTTNNFDSAGTAYTLSRLGAGSGGVVAAGGPSGSFLRLITQDTGTNRNRITFDQTANGSYDKLTADFDFRAVNASTPPPTGTPTLQDFDSAGSAYVLTNYDTADPGTPVIRPADAGSSGQYARLTRQLNDERGGLFFDATAASAYNYVIINFDFRITSAGTPADGMGFIFLNTANWGTSGATASWSEDANMAGSIGVGLDVYNNGPTATEPNANHVSLHYGSQVANGVASPTLSLAAGKFHRAQIILKFETGRALVTVRISPDVNGAGGPMETLFSDFIITGPSAYRGRAAFCARTGGANADHEIDNVNIQYLTAEPPSAGGLSMLLLPASTYGTTGAGTTTNHFLDIPAVSNVFALNFDCRVFPVVNDVNLYWNAAQSGNMPLPSAPLDLDNGLFHHAHLEFTRTLEGALATMTLSPDVYGAGGTPVTVFSNLLVKGFQPGDSRVEFAGRSGGQNLTIDVENVRVLAEEYQPNLLAAGQRILLVSDLAGFQSRYGTGLPVAGEFTGNLDNGGERIQLVGRYDEPIIDFSYNDTWAPLTDGYGYALVPVNPNVPFDQWNNPANWRAGTYLGGTPGGADPAAPVVAPVVINEVLAHSDTNLQVGVMDAIELHNPTTNPADVSGWWLSDNFDQPKKYRLPIPTTIPAGGFLVIYESQFNAPGSGANGFGLRAEGEEVYLFSADSAGNITGYFHGFDFGASDPNTTFGRYVDSESDDQFVTQAAVTFGATNAGPRVGPVVITEVMYHPPENADGTDNDFDEFIEVRNITGGPVSLFDVNYPANTWHLRDAVDFEFPSGVELPAGGFALVVSFDPDWEPLALDAFRAHYGLGAEVPVFGPFTGKLDNSSDSVELTKPGDPDPQTGNPTAILVDKVKYRDNPPWPQAADGVGFSLQRLNDAQFGNDPVNWIAFAWSPGQARPVVAPGPPTIATQPASQTVFAFMPVTFSVTPAGTGPFLYQWRFDGNNLPGATNQTLLLPSVLAEDSGFYQVIVLNAGGAAESSNAVLTVQQASTVLSQPGSRSVWPGSNTLFTVSALGNGPVSYQWRSNGVDITGATTASYSIPNVQPYHAGDYTVIMTDAVGPVSSVPATLTVFTSPIFTVQPTNRVVPLTGSSVVNVTSVAAAFSSTPVRYQWRFNGTNLPNATNATLVISNVQPVNGGIYAVAASDNFGTSVSTNATLTVALRATITQQPQGLTVVAGQSAGFTVAATGSTPMFFRWRRNANTISNGTPGVIIESEDDSSTLTLSEAAYFNDFDRYSVVITNLGGSTPVSSNALLRVLYPPVLTAQPTNLYVNAGTTATFRATFRANPAANYSWWFNETNLLTNSNGIVGTNLLGTNISLVISNVQAADEGLYTLTVSNEYGFTTSTGAVLELRRPPTIVTQPQSQTVAPGTDVTFSVGVSGTPAFRYTWKLNGADLPGATNASLLLTNVQTSQAGDYLVVVMNALGSATSDVATLNVSAAPTLDGVVYDAGTGKMKFNVATLNGVTYLIQYKDDLGAAEWQTLQTVVGDGSVVTVEDPVAPPPSQRFYQIRTQ